MKTEFNKIDIIKTILACPHCKGDILFKKKDLYCVNCNKHYPLINSKPVMLNEKEIKEIKAYLKIDRDSERMVEVFSDTQSKFAKVYRKIRPNSILNRRVNIERIKSLINRLPNDGIGLEIGSGKSNRANNVINLDISPFKNVDIIGIGEKLPFKDKSFELVIIQAVLEHVKNPSILISEIYRVLKTGATIYAETAFMQAYHGFPAHYFNCTKKGVEQLFSKFTKLEFGILGGPSETLINVVRMYLSILFNANKFIRIFIYLIIGYLLFPLKFLDLYLSTKKESHKLATSFYYIGRKSA